jgi:hypothetical protein
VTAHRRTLHIEPPSFSKELSLSNGVSAATNVTLSFLKDLYNFANFTPAATSSTSQNLLGVTGYAVHQNNINSSTPQHGFLGTWKNTRI